MKEIYLLFEGGVAKSFVAKEKKFQMITNILMSKVSYYRSSVENSLVWFTIIVQWP